MGIIEIASCPVCGATDCQIGSVKFQPHKFAVYCSTPHCLIGPAYDRKAQAIQSWTRLSQAARRGLLAMNREEQEDATDE